MRLIRRQGFTAEKVNADSAGVTTCFREIGSIAFNMEDHVTGSKAKCGLRMSGTIIEKVSN